MTCPVIEAKPLPKDAKTPLPVDVQRSKMSLPMLPVGVFGVGHVGYSLFSNYCV